ncbi:helicase-like protein [Barrientosiimonas humi]|uniref:Helicase-like protein n=2 Tax=Barrientosiimonas TaxID=1535207 RepID=A0A542XF63_9MICO|nr:MULTISPECIES: DEAD/DEAH box helicase [Barrientosiimonas]TQL34446.1 helicase-like protein [Barrientosiimonas humi]BDZ59513.1 DEAD/DEAH box helicase [Barrientosiimonas endolithica]CAG7574435.1 putative helicase HelY [Barrientosiimonas humi]
MTPRLTDRTPSPAEPDAIYEAFQGWAGDRGIDLYPHQDEAIIELVGGANVILATPTGSGKSLVATAAHFTALAQDKVSFYTAPIKALVSEKFFALIEQFGADNVGMLTGDAAVNADAPIICCTAEVLANIALREGRSADVGMVIMDEFHFYSEPDRGWAWQVPLLELPQAQFLLMSATLGDVARFEEDLTRRTGRPTATVATAERPVPLSFSYAMTPLHETLEELLTTHQAPVYVVHFTQAAALERAQALMSLSVASKEERARIAELIGGFRFSAGFGKTLNRLVRHGIGVHHAGMLPKYRRLVETLAQAGLLKVICGTDTLGVGINVPIRTVVFTGLTKFDGSRNRLLKAREFHQIAGRAGRAGYDTSGSVVVQAPEHAIENARALAKAGDDPKKQRKVQRKKPPEGFVSWSEETFDKLVAAQPEALQSRMRVTHSMLLNVIAREGDPFPAMRSLVRENHEDPRRQARLAKGAITLYRELLAAGVVEKLSVPEADGRQVRLTVDLQDNFALNQPLAPFALAVLDVLDPESETYARDVVSVIEAILEDPRPVLLAQRRKVRGEAIAEMKADGIEYDERMELLEDISWPQPLAELLDATFETYRSGQPWVAESALSPKTVVREMYENAWSFGDLVKQYDLSRSEGIVLRYLTDAYRTLRQTVPDRYRDEELDDLVEWLGETVRQTDSSLLDEWEALSHPEEAALEGGAPSATTVAPRPITSNPRAFRVSVRNAMFRRVQLAARRDVVALAALDRAAAESTDPPTEIVMDEGAWHDDLAAYFADHDEMGAGASARGPAYLRITQKSDMWEVRQVIEDPEDDGDWGIDAQIPLAASDEAGAPVIVVLGLNRLDVVG